MIRYIFLLFFCLTIFQKTQAQAKQDTLAYFMKDNGTLAANKDSADYLLVIMPPAPDTKLYPVLEYYRNGKRKLIGASLTQSRFLSLDGACITYFPNGRRKSTGVYEHGNLVGEATEYFPNGQLYTLKKYQDRAAKYLECRDSAGTVLANNGNGQWILYNDDYTRKVREGKVKNGSLTGFFEPYIDTARDAAYDKTGGIVKNPDVQPTFTGGIEAFHTFLGRTIKYPAIDRENNNSGKVYITFVIEKDGALSHCRVDKAPSKTLGDEALRAVQTSPLWTPGTVSSKPVRVEVTVPVIFTGSGQLWSIQ